MKTFNLVRHIMAFVVLACYPPAILLWVAIHPFAQFWRKMGPGWTYALLAIPVAGYMIGAWFFRGTLLGRDLGTSVIALTMAALCIAAGALLNRQRRKLLDFGTLSGLPELSRKRYPGKLLKEGIYGRIRHPRYVEVLLITCGYAFFANYLGAYLVVLLSIPLVYLVTLFEERELRERFGAAYEEYCRCVPRFVPKRKPRHDGD
ncbi:MAG: isoprenylcysteine carboxylmethyltransferase family protein [Acidobacteria bacterium]|jgi:protein-S-isoprenylcysteine O-methyltransferase Ste14|nr:isoprenylcysteine carboxylmethyltransferase family protein [Acidobacteriota bacterium]